MNILKLAAQLSLDGTRFKAGLKEAEVATTRFGSNIGSSIKGQLAAAFGASAMVAFAAQAVKDTAALKDQAEQARMNTTEWQRVKLAVEDAGLSETEFLSSQNKFDQNRREAVESNEELRKTFLKYGMTLDDLQDPQQTFVDFLGKANKALNNMSPEEKARASVELFDMLGKAGPKLEGLFAAVEKFKNSKEIVAPEAIDGLDRADKKLASIWRNLKNVTAMTVGQLISAPGMAYDAFQQRNALGPAITAEQRVQLSAEADANREVNKPADLFKTKEQRDLEARAKKSAEQAVKDAEKFAADRDRFNFKKMSESEQRALIESKLKEQMSVMGPIDQRSVLDLMQQLPGSKFSKPSASSLTSVGQLSGRNFVNSGESATVRAARELLKPAQESAKTLNEINLKVKPGKTLNATL